MTAKDYVKLMPKPVICNIQSNTIGGDSNSVSMTIKYMDNELLFVPRHLSTEIAHILLSND